MWSLVHECPKEKIFFVKKSNIPPVLLYNIGVRKKETQKNQPYKKIKNFLKKYCIIKK